MPDLHADHDVRFEIKDAKKKKKKYKPSFCIKPCVGEVGPEKGHFCFVFSAQISFFFNRIHFLVPLSWNQGYSSTQTILSPI